MKNEEMIGVMLQDEGDDGQAKQRRKAEGGRRNGFDVQPGMKSTSNVTPGRFDAFRR